MRAEGLDVERLCTYQMAMASGFEMEGVTEPVSVVWIREEYLKKDLCVEFWVILTQRYGPGLTIEDAREADRIFDVLMGAEVAPRKKFIQTHAKKVKNLDI